MLNLALLLAFQGLCLAADRPVLRVDVPYPTRDKPQSKLWFARGSWWTWLPVRGGSGVWKRTGTGWERQSHLDQHLRGLPRQADVWADGEQVHAVLVEPNGLAVVGLRWSSPDQRYRLDAPPVKLSTPGPAVRGQGIESATITRDSRRRWWIAYNWNRDMWVRSSLDGRQWSNPVAVTTSKASDDDLCSIVALPDRVGVVWSDQVHDAVYFRWRLDTAPPDEWSPAEVVQQGGLNADDHIHTAVTEGGILYVATKNSLDAVGQAQLVLRIRDTQGRWTNIPYAQRTEKYHPSRPIALLLADPARLFLLHTLYRLDHPIPRQSTIVWQTTGLSRLELAPVATPLLDAGTQLNDVTGSKAPLPPGQTWIVLASDQDGNVYEGKLN
ncbi:MAG: hypothetical protein HY820_23210 [Acidobacteria bacterium]|nr:hypothetical protein [Acidobacteriota bacterium]